MRVLTVIFAISILSSSCSTQSAAPIVPQEKHKVDAIPTMDVKTAIDVINIEETVVYEEKTTAAIDAQKLQINENGFFGEKSYHFTYVPTEIGKFTLPAYGISYFDLKSKSFKTLSVPEQIITVEKGENGYENIWLIGLATQVYKGEI
mgnify:CR=1 FL=1